MTNHTKERYISSRLPLRCDGSPPFSPSLSCIYVGDILGHKRTCILGLVITIFGPILQASAFSLLQLTIAKFVGVTAIGPNWQSETVQPGLKGATVMLQSTFISNSPRWLIKKGRIDEAREILVMLGNEPNDSPSIVHQIEEIEASLQETGQGSFKDIFRNGRARFANRAFIAVSTQMGQQICGANAITFYQSTSFKNHLGMNRSLALLMSAVLFTWHLLSPLPITS
ncbi:hypothetical protein RU639_010827 [Aspergillus parasiticus]